MKVHQAGFFKQPVIVNGGYQKTSSAGRINKTSQDHGIQVSVCFYDSSMFFYDVPPHEV